MFCGHKTLSYLSEDINCGGGGSFYVSFTHCIKLSSSCFLFILAYVFYTGCFPRKSGNLWPWLIFTSEAFKMTKSAVHVQSLLTGPSHHGSFQWNPPDITICPGTGIPRANRKKRARSSPIWLANCQPIPIFRYIASSPPILVSMSPSSASWVQSPWRIKFSPGCCSGKVGIVLW